MVQLCNGISARQNLGVRQERLVGLLIEAIKDQQKQIDDLECQIEEIKHGST